MRRSRLAFAPELPPDIWRIIFERLGVSGFFVLVAHILWQHLKFQQINDTHTSMQPARK